MDAGLRTEPAMTGAVKQASAQPELVPRGLSSLGYEQCDARPRNITGPSPSTALAHWRRTSCPTRPGSKCSARCREDGSPLGPPRSADHFLISSGRLRVVVPQLLAVVLLRCASSAR